MILIIQAFEFGAQLLWNVEFKAMMPIFSDKLLHVEVVIEGKYWSVKSTQTHGSMAQVRFFYLIAVLLLP